MDLEFLMRRCSRRIDTHARKLCPAGCRCVDAFDALGLDRCELGALDPVPQFDAVRVALLTIPKGHTERYALATRLFAGDAVPMLLEWERYRAVDITPGRPGQGEER